MVESMRKLGEFILEPEDSTSRPGESSILY